MRDQTQKPGGKQHNAGRLRNAGCDHSMSVEWIAGVERTDRPEVGIAVAAIQQRIDPRRS